MRPALTFDSLEYWMPDARISFLAFAAQVPGNRSEDRDEDTDNAEDQDQRSMRVLPRRYAVMLAVRCGRPSGLKLRRHECGIVWDLLGVGILSMAAGHGRQLFPM